MRDDNLETLFSRLTKKLNNSNPLHHVVVGSGWLKYEWNQSFWSLDDESDYAIFTWRMKPDTTATSHDQPTLIPPPAPTPTLFLAEPGVALPGHNDYQNPSFYAFRPKAHHHHTRSGSPDGINGRPKSVRSVRSRRSTKHGSVIGEPEDYKEEYKYQFNKFHTENGVRTVTGKIGPVEGGS